LDAAKGSPKEDSVVHKMVLNIGKRPTVQDGAGITVEAHILHAFAADFYGRDLRLVVTGYLRCAVVFPLYCPFIGLL
jgi:riboflavin kinase